MNTLHKSYWATKNKFFIYACHSNQWQKRGRCFTNNNKAWMIHWKVCCKDWHLSRKRPEIGLCQKISSLYKVSSVSNVCLSFTKQVNYKVSSITKTYALWFNRRTIQLKQENFSCNNKTNIIGDELLLNFGAKFQR